MSGDGIRALPDQSATEHTCSEYTRERCPECGHEDSRDGFEGVEGTRRDAAHGRLKFVVRCPKCEALHPDQSNHDEDGCEACDDEMILADRAALDEERRDA